MKLSRTNLTLSVVAALALSTAVVWDQAQAAPDRRVDVANVPAAQAGRSGVADQRQQKPGGGSDPLAAGAPAQPTKAPVVNSNQASSSIAYLKTHYGVSATEALRRLNLQASAEQLDQQLRASLPDSYGGMWLDQTHGGVLRIAATDSGAVTAAIGAAADRAHIAVVPVDRSLRQLDALATDVQAQVGANAQVSVDVTSNQVAVYQVAGAAAAGAAAHTTKDFAAAQKSVAKPDPRVATVVAAHPGVVLRQLVIGEAKSGPVAAARPITVPEPVGAGSKLIIRRTTANTDSDNENTMYGECTLGFVVYDSVNAAYYALTAGHCVTGSDKTGINQVYDLFLRPFGAESPTYQQSTYPTDYALITIPDAAKRYGDSANRNFTQCLAGTGKCGNLPLQVTGVRGYSSGAGVGDIVCAIGKGDNDQYGYKSSTLPPGTRCGEITDTNGGFVASICSRKGDSGGPLFSEATGLAYGILNDGSPASPTCLSSEWSQYSPVSEILIKLNKQGSGLFALRNVP